VIELGMGEMKVTERGDVKDSKVVEGSLESRQGLGLDLWSN
jgi:hypothetical protein